MGSVDFEDIPQSGGIQESTENHHRRLPLFTADGNPSAVQVLDDQGAERPGRQITYKDNPTITLYYWGRQQERPQIVKSDVFPLHQVNLTTW